MYDRLLSFQIINYIAVVYILDCICFESLGDPESPFYVRVLYMIRCNFLVE